VESPSALEFPIYLDHHATTPCDPRVVEAMLPYFSDDFGNASSSGHVFGWRADAAVESARERLAAALGAADPREIIFTSGTTESNNLAIQGVARAARDRCDHLITSAVEHPSVLDCCRALEREGWRVSVLPVDAQGCVDPEAVARALTPRTALVSVMAANGEIGSLQPIGAIGRICREHGVPFHTDAAQAVGKVPVDVEGLEADLLSLCAHKLYGPKGVGALYVRRARPRPKLLPLVHGGGQERGLRSGTLPVPLIVGFARAVELCLEELPREAVRLEALRDRLFERLVEGLDGVRRHGSAAQRLPGNLHVSFAGVDAASLLVSLHDVALSTGSACASASPEPSHVLRAIGLSNAQIRGALRIGLGRGNTEEEIDFVADRLVERVREQREKRAGGSGAGPLRILDR
jgi:cysteine desulfurase